MTALPNGLSFRGLKARSSEAMTRRNQWQDELEDAYDYLMPRRSIWTKRTPGEDRYSHIFDPIGMLALRRHVSRMQSSLMPPWRQWSELTPGLDFEGSPQEVEIARLLDDSTRLLFKFINHSQSATAIPESMQESAISTGALLIQPGTREAPLKFYAEPAANIGLEEGPDGEIDGIWRFKEVRIEWIERMWPGAKLSGSLSTAAAVPGGERKKVEVHEGTVWHQGMWYTFLLDAGSPKEDDGVMLSIQQGPDRHDSPWVVFREGKAPDEVNGRGPALEALSTVKTCNKVVEFTLRAAALRMAGVYTGVNSDAFNISTARIMPGGILPVMSNARENPSIRGLELPGDFNTGLLTLDLLHNQVFDTMNAPLSDPTLPFRTATKEAIDREDFMIDEGANLGRLQTEMVEGVVGRCVRILVNFGWLPPIKVDGTLATLKHTSPLARAQDDKDLRALMRAFEAGLNTVGPELIARGIKVEDIPRHIAELTGIPSDLVRSEAEMAQVDQNMAQVAQAAQEEAA